MVVFTKPYHDVLGMRKKYCGVPLAVLIAAVLTTSSSLVSMSSAAMGPGQQSSGDVVVGEQLIKPACDKLSYRVVELPNKLRVLLIHDPETDKAAAALDVSLHAALATSTVNTTAAAVGVHHTSMLTITCARSASSLQSDSTVALLTFLGYSSPMHASLRTGWIPSAPKQPSPPLDCCWVPNPSLQLCCCLSTSALLRCAAAGALLLFLRYAGACGQHV